jgi:hypothetical protein
MKHLLTFFTIVFLTSCGALKNAQMTEDINGGKDKAMKYFVVYKDGNVAQMSQFKTTTAAPFGTSKIILDDGTKVAQADVQSFQDNIGFHTRSSDGTFVIRIKKGAINVYQSSQIAGIDGTKPAFVKVAWVQKGDKSEIVKLTPNVLKELVRDYDPVTEMVNKIKGSFNYKAMDEAID